jgi:hypothetical protein
MLRRVAVGSPLLLGVSVHFVSKQDSEKPSRVTPSKPEPQFNELVQYAEMANLCGKNDALIHDWLDKHDSFNGITIKEVPKVEQRYIILHSEGKEGHEVTVIVRGMATWFNFFITQCCWQINDSTLNIPLHYGFKIVADVIFDDLQEELKRLRAEWHMQAGPNPAPLKVNLTGHSLGGAVAVILAMKLGLEKCPGIEIGKVVTFGQVRDPHPLMHSCTHALMHSLLIHSQK